MSWTSFFVVYRVTNDKSVTEVFESSDLQKAKYWIKYIAQPGDVLCRTPLSPKHSKASGQPEYWCHKEASGQPETNHEAWLKSIKAFWPDFQFPENQTGESASSAPA